jgi:hypothetical protein
MARAAIDSGSYAQNFEADVVDQQQQEADQSLQMYLTQGYNLLSCEYCAMRQNRLMITLNQASSLTGPQVLLHGLQECFLPSWLALIPARESRSVLSDTCTGLDNMSILFHFSSQLKASRRSEA